MRKVPCLLPLVLVLAGCLPDLEPPDGVIAGDDSDGDGTPDAADCAPNDNSVHPGANELCNQRDDDCDGTEDENAVDGTTYHLDADDDGFGSTDDTVVACPGTEGLTTDARDCDDSDELINPTVHEACDEANKDEDCDGMADDEDQQSNEVDGRVTWYYDRDGDGYGTDKDPLVNCDGDPSAVDDITQTNGDCDDDDEAIHPGAAEVCDEADNDCDLQTDANDDDVQQQAYYKDVDADGFGAGSATIGDCIVPFGYATTNTDCDDEDPNIKPGASEACDAAHTIDEDCDGEADDLDPEGAFTNVTVWYADDDKDGEGDPTDAIRRCVGTIAGRVTNGYDCDDADSTLNQSTEWHKDGDSDGYGDATGVVGGCVNPGSYVHDGTDCNDSAGHIHPAAGDSPGVDNDCNSRLGLPIFPGSMLLSGLPRIDGTVLGGRFGTNATPAQVGVAVAGPNTGTAAGAVYVVNVPAAGATTPILASSASLVLNDGDTGFGTGLDSGDLDGNGTIDLVIGCPLHSDGYYGGQEGGHVYAVTKTVGTPINVETCKSATCTVCNEYGPGDDAHLGGSVVIADETTGLTVLGADDLAAGAVHQYNWEFGTCPPGPLSSWDNVEPGGDATDAVITQGDLDGDGFADIIVGAPHSPSDAGRVVVVLGPDPGLVVDLATGFDAKFTGGADEQAGASLASDFDSDADGYDDLLIGAPHAGSPGVGQAYLIYGRGAWPATVASNTAFRSTASNDSTGASVAAIGDLDGDRGDEIAIGAPRMKNGTVITGGVWIPLGKNLPQLSAPVLLNTTTSLVLLGTSVNDSAGAFVGDFVDIDSDGYGDFVVGAPGAQGTGSLYVIYVQDLF